MSNPPDPVPQVKRAKEVLKENKEAAAKDAEAKSALRDLQNEFKTNNKKLRDIRTGALNSFVQNLDSNLTKVGKSGNLASDATLFKDCTAVAHETVTTMAGDEERTIPKFLQGLKAKYVGGVEFDKRGRDDPSAFRWDLLCRDVAKYFRPGVGVNCMLGALDAQAKARKVAAPRQKRVIAEVVRPDELDNAPGVSEKQATDKLMVELHTRLFRMGEQGCSVARLILNPQSFAQTVENQFALSFVVREGKAILDIDKETGKLMAIHRDRLQGQGQGAALGTALQFVTSLTMYDWEVLKKYVPDPVMPHRRKDDPPQPATGTGGSGQKRQRR